MINLVGHFSPSSKILNSAWSSWDSFACNESRHYSYPQFPCTVSASNAWDYDHHLVRTHAKKEKKRLHFQRLSAKVGSTDYKLHLIIQIHFKHEEQNKWILHTIWWTEQTEKEGIGRLLASFCTSISAFLTNNNSFILKKYRLHCKHFLRVRECFCSQNSWREEEKGRPKATVRVAISTLPNLPLS